MRLEQYFICNISLRQEHGVYDCVQFSVIILNVTFNPSAIFNLLYLYFSSTGLFHHYLTSTYFPKSIVK